MVDAMSMEVKEGCRVAGLCKTEQSQVKEPEPKGGAEARAEDVIAGQSPEGVSSGQDLFLPRY
jgi:hypothetical protein